MSRLSLDDIYETLPLVRTDESENSLLYNHGRIGKRWLAPYPTPRIIECGGVNHMEQMDGDAEIQMEVLAP